MNFWVSLKHDGTDETDEPVKMASLCLTDRRDRWNSYSRRNSGLGSRDTQTGPWKWPVCLSSLEQWKRSVFLSFEAEHMTDRSEKDGTSTTDVWTRSPTCRLYTPHLPSFLADLGDLQWLLTQQHFQPVSDYVRGSCWSSLLIDSCFSWYILRGYRFACYAMHVSILKKVKKR